MHSRCPVCRTKLMCTRCEKENTAVSNSVLSAGLIAFTDADKKEIDNLDARLKRSGFSWHNTDHLTMQDIIPKVKALIDSSR